MSNMFWKKIELSLTAGTLIPVLGPGVITFGENDRLLRPWLVAEVAKRLCLNGEFADLNVLVCAHLRAGGKVDEVSYHLDELLRSPEIQPGALLKKFASLSQCQHFFTLAFDPLMERALNEVRGAGRPIVKRWVFESSQDDGQDVDLKGLNAPFLGYLFGKVSHIPRFHLWDADAVEYVINHQRAQSASTQIAKALATKDLLVMGTHLSDWTVRFLFRVIRGKLFGDSKDNVMLLADSAPPNHKKAQDFYGSLRKGIEVLEMDPIEFAREFCTRAFALQPPLKLGFVPGKKPGEYIRIPDMEPTAPKDSIFISYAHTDAADVFHLVERLRAAGCIVWLDRERIQCGDDFENKLKDAVKENCGFFISVISKTTESRYESYFHKERHWAEERFPSIASRRKFYFPVVIDNTPIPPRNEPRSFEKIDAVRTSDEERLKDFIANIAALQNPHQ